MTPLDAIRCALDASHGSAKAFQAELAQAGFIVVSAAHAADQLDALRAACRLFRDYQAHHLAKETPEGREKAARNGDMANRIEASLNRTMGEGKASHG